MIDIPPPIPPAIDHLSIIAELNSWGLRDYKIEFFCGFSKGYISQLKCGNSMQMTYQRAARLYMFWRDELEERASRGTLPIQNVAETTT